MEGRSGRPPDGARCSNGNGNSNLALVTRLAKQVQQQAVFFEQKSELWIPSKVLSFRPYVRPSSPGGLVNGMSTGRGGKQQLHGHHGRVANGFHVEEQQEKGVICCPLVAKLTKDIVETYKVCNPGSKWSVLPKRYLTTPSEGVSNDGRDNVDNDLILYVDYVLINSELNVFYAVKDMLGKGSYGQVCRCWTNNPKYPRDVAVKVIKNRGDYCDYGEREMDFCKWLSNDCDPYDEGNIVRFLEAFVFAGHLCLVFELLSIDLHALSKLNFYGGFSIKVVRRFTKQILEALAVLRANGVMHCDLKPENIVLHPGPLEAFTVELLEALRDLRKTGGTHPDLKDRHIILHPWFLENSARIKLIDFGLASYSPFSAGERNTYIQSRHYRAPEVVLKLSYTPAMDMWSLGCVAAELFTGIPLFPGANEYDLFRFMIEILGCQPPDEIIRASEDEVRARFFKLASCDPNAGPMEIDGHQFYQFLSEADIEARMRAYGFGKPKAERRQLRNRTLGDIIMSKKERRQLGRKMTPNELMDEISCRAAFLDFLIGVLHFDPAKRWTPREALQHPFLTGEQFSGTFMPRSESQDPLLHGPMNGCFVHITPTQNTV